jgi:hypothetical protein
VREQGRIQNFKLGGIALKKKMRRAEEGAKTDRHDITEMLLKVALSTITLIHIT